MSITVNDQPRVPPGFRFHPTEEELLNYYLRKKVANEKIDLDVIRDVDLNKLEPWDIQEKCRIGSAPQNDWYFFSHKDKKYPTGTRTNRATAAGFWKATGRDKVIYTSVKQIGMRKTLVFYKGRAPHGQKSDWIMHEYRLDENPDSISQSNGCGSIGDVMGQEDGWVVCREFKKNYHKGLDNPKNSSSTTSEAKTQMLHPSNDRALDQILHYMGRSCKQESGDPKPSSKSSKIVDMKYLFPVEIGGSSKGVLERFMKLPALESPSFLNSNVQHQFDQSYCNIYQSSEGLQPPQAGNLDINSDPQQQQGETTLHDWATVDRLVASHLNVQMDASKQLNCFDDDIGYGSFCSSTANRLISTQPQDYNNDVDDGSDIDLWGAFTAAGSASSSGSDNHLCQTPE